GGQNGTASAAAAGERQPDHRRAFVSGCQPVAALARRLVKALAAPASVYSAERAPVVQQGRASATDFLAAGLSAAAVRSTGPPPSHIRPNERAAPQAWPRRARLLAACLR